MNRAKRQELPPGWNEKKILAVIAHYDQQTEEDAAAEIETAHETAGETWICVPTELIGVVARLIEDHAKNATPAPSRNHKKKAGTKKAPRSETPKR